MVRQRIAGMAGVSLVMAPLASKLHANWRGYSMLWCVWGVCVCVCVDEYSQALKAPGYG